MMLSLGERKKAKEASEALKTMCQGAERAKVAKIHIL